MSAFSAAWLDVREDADRRARNGDVADALAAWFALRDGITVVDLGAGTGANLRATAPLLPARQHWRLIENDGALIDAAKERFARWADTAQTADNDVMHLERAGQSITVSFQRYDLIAGIAPLVADRPGLVTASALFDLTSTAFMRDCVRTVADARSAFLATLTYNGTQRWTPPRPLDNQVIAAINRHQLGDKGFGPAAGPLAAAELGDQLRISGFSVSEGDSPWQLTKRDQPLIEALKQGTAEAALEAGLDDGSVARWRSTAHNGAMIGHTDLFAVIR